LRPSRHRPATLAFALLACLLPFLASARIAPDQRHYARYEYTVQADKHYTEIRTVETRLANAGMVAEAGTASFDFDPADESLEVLEAWVEEPDGTRIDVPPASIYTRPSAAARNAPGFVATQTTTVVFPQLQTGSVVHSKWRHTVKTARIFGFNANVLLGLEAHTAVEVRIEAPASLPLAWRQRGGFATEETVTGDTRVITASASVGTAPRAEPFMVSPVDVGPAFVASTLSGYEEIGAIYAARSAGKAVVTPEIAALARSVAGAAQGLDAARAMHDWVAAHIRYVAVYLDPADDLVPHDAAAVLRNGYGDCKDHVVLMQALLSAIGIRAEAALVNWDNRMQPLPLWSGASFNHALVYLPDFDVYGNTTDPYAALGALDILLSDKLVVIASQQGEVRRTPASAPEQNRFRMEATLSIAADGTVSGANTMTASPRLEAPLRRAVATAGPPEALGSRLLAPTPEGGFGSLHASDPRDLSTSLKLSGRWNSPHGVVRAAPSTYMTVPLGIDMTPSGDMRAYLAREGRRRFPLMIGARDYTWIYRIRLPAGAVVEHLPADVDVATPAGQVTARHVAEADGITVTRRLRIAHDIYAADAYPAIEALLYAYIDAQRAVLAYRPAP
jgi:transglutaminase-like putative cysteine protease